MSLTGVSCVRRRVRRGSIADRGFDAEQVDAEIAADKAREQALGLVFGKAPAAAAEVPADPPEELVAVDQAALG